MKYWNLAKLESSRPRTSTEVGSVVNISDTFRTLLMKHMHAVNFYLFNIVEISFETRGIFDLVQSSETAEK